MPRRLFDELEPPPGGLARLRARLREEQQRRAPWRLLWPALGACAAAAALAVLAPGAPRDRRSPWGAPGLAASGGRPGAPAVSPLPGSRTAVELVAGGEVPIFRVSSLGERSP
jgi:hypothetical protein